MKQIIYTTKISDEDYNLAKETLILNGEDENPSDDVIYEQIAEEKDIEWEDIKNDLEHFFSDKPVIFFGTFGKWNGSSKAHAIGSFFELFNQVIKDCDDIEIAEIDNHFMVNAWHHDGQNSFEVKVLSYEGINYLDQINVSLEYNTIINDYSYYPGYLSGQVYTSKKLNHKFDITKFKKKKED